MKSYIRIEMAKKTKELKKSVVKEKEKVMAEREFTVLNVMEDSWVVDVPMVHDDVRCVGCTTKPIVGKRFECDQCFAYNLCEDCYAGKNKSPALPALPDDHGGLWGEEGGGAPGDLSH